MKELGCIVLPSSLQRPSVVPWYLKSLSPSLSIMTPPTDVLDTLASGAAAAVELPSLSPSSAAGAAHLWVGTGGWQLSRGAQHSQESITTEHFLSCASLTVNDSFSLSHQSQCPGHPLQFFLHPHQEPNCQHGPVDPPLIPAQPPSRPSTCRCPGLGLFSPGAAVALPASSPSSRPGPEGTSHAALLRPQGHCRQTPSLSLPSPRPAQSHCPSSSPWNSPARQPPGPPSCASTVQAVPLTSVWLVLTGL